MRTPYPRTPHLPWSPGAGPDDVRVGDLSALRGREVVVTEKLDGENTTLYRDGLHARSPDSGHHPSRAWVKALHGRVAAAIPAGWRVCGENLYARHSLPYGSLDGYFYLFSVWDGDRCLDWDATVRFAAGLGVPVPAVLWRGPFDERALRRLRPDPAVREGYVVRAAGAFDRSAFAGHVAKWVRAGHVTTGTHWMHAAVVRNGLGPGAALYDVRSGAAPDPAALAAAVGTTVGQGCADAVDGVAARLDVAGRRGDPRLAAVLAALLHRHRRSAVVPLLAPRLGVAAARRVADLAGLHPRLHREVPDAARRAGLRRMSLAADLGLLHAVAAATAADAGQRAQVEWSLLHADDDGLLTDDPVAALRAGAREAFGGLPAAAADRCWAEARDAWAAGRIETAAEAAAYTWRWRGGGYAQLVVLCGPAGSGKSRFAAGLPGATVVALDDLRAARGARGDQRHNRDVLRDGLDRLDTVLARADGSPVVWDATSLTGPQRAVVRAVARRRDAWTTHAVLFAGEAELARRNRGREHAVPASVLADQVRRFAPPYPGDAHRTWYVGAAGTVDDVDGTLRGDG